MPENMFEEVQKILSKQLRREPETIQLTSLIKKDLGADSLDILQLLMRMEDDFGIVIPDEELAGFNTVGDVVNYLDSQK